MRLIDEVKEQTIVNEIADNIIDMQEVDRDWLDRRRHIINKFYINIRNNAQRTSLENHLNNINIDDLIEHKKYLNIDKDFFTTYLLNNFDNHLVDFEEKLCWKTLNNSYSKIPDTFIEKYFHKFNWKHISQRCDIKEKFANKLDININKLTTITLDDLIRNPKIDEKIITKNIRKYNTDFNWVLFSQQSFIFSKYPKEFLKKYQQHIRWDLNKQFHYLLGMEKIDSLNKVNKKSLNWGDISMKMLMTPSYIRENEEFVIFKILGNNII